MTEPSARSARLAALPPPVRFGFWMVMSGLCFAALLGLVRYLAEDSGLDTFVAVFWRGDATIFDIVRYLGDDHGLDVFVISFWRNGFSILVFLPWLLQNGIGAAKSHRHGMLISRAALMITSSTAMFFAAALIPLAEATAISFTTPLFSILLAMIFLREKVGPRRLGALAIGLLGVLIILRPGAAAIDPAAGLPLLAALTFGGVVVLSKALTTNDSSEAIGFWLATYMLPMSLVPALFFWSWPDWGHMPWLVALGAAAAGNLYFITRAVRIGDASQTAPYDCVRLPFVALVGYVFFAQTVDIWVWVGAAVILASTIYVTWREAQLHRARAAAT